MRVRPFIDSDGLLEFTLKADFLGDLCVMFRHMIFDPAERDTYPEETVNTWLEIFRQPIIYPPPSNHPLFLSPTERENPRQPFVETVLLFPSSKDRPNASEKKD